MTENVIRFLTVIIKKCITWIIIPGVFFFLFIYFFQPERFLMEHITTILMDRAGIQLDYTDVRFVFPGKINVRDIRLKQTNVTIKDPDNIDRILSERMYFSGDRIAFSIAFGLLLRGKSALRFSGIAYDGTFSGLIQTEISRTPKPLAIKIIWSDINMSRLSEDYPDLAVSTGTCHGKADLTVDFSQRFIYRGPVQISVENTRFQVPDRFPEHVSMPVFDNVEASFTMNHSEIQIHRIVFTSYDTIIRVLGTIHQKMPLSGSDLDLQIRVHLISDTQPYNEDMYLPLTLKGPISNPKAYFLGREM
jgi:type II secretion system protein N